ncbi:DUF4345 domain-containing protein [Pseudoxanthomonas gei]|uniref:DUF4345 domain-containing protein n=1 Tax=Pseudoxanthomonas gei TaxID=1383030 RepID=A0ABX0ADS9_9GAMM|nr:DUF4345 domain-containing protein [Pseudoxanthomonas gei]NDK37404.1 DUF4345 domain-containing protein [Pseudoxanthomonas gei]
MVNAYLYLNAVLYALLALWCTLFPGTTASAVGYQVLSRSGQSEYLVIYGGLQLGMAFLFAYFARTRQPRNGVVLALAFYIPIVLYRAVSMARLWPLEPATLLLALLEWMLLIAAVLLWKISRPRK